MKYVILAHTIDNLGVP